MYNTQDTLRVMDRPAAIILPADTIPVRETDTLPAQEGGTLPVREADTLFVPVSDTLIHLQSDTLRAIPGQPPPLPTEETVVTTGDKSAEDVITPALVTVSETVTPAVRQEGPLTPFREPLPVSHRIRSREYDASYYLDGRADIAYFEHYRPAGRISGFNEPDLSRPVFLEEVPSAGNKTSATYETYLITPVVSGPAPEAHFAATWIPALVILSFLLLTWIKLIYVQFLTPLLVSTFNYKEAFKLYQSRNVPAQNAFMILHLIFAINSGLFLLFVSWYFDIGIPGFHPALHFLIASSMVVLLFALKSFFLRLTGFLFDRSRLLAEYDHNISLYNKIFGILLLPVIIALLYGGDNLHSVFIYTGLGMGFVFYLLQLVRGMEIIMKKEFSLFYLFLYLCAFEILPILVLYKLFQVLLM